MIVVADTSPLNYLILIKHIDILARLYGEVVIPPAVQDELLSCSAPADVRTWIDKPPAWLEVRTPSRIPTSLHPDLGLGEREAIALAQASTSGTVLLLDDRLGRHEAERLGLKVAGTLAVLLQAHRDGLLSFRDALERLQKTNFKASPTLLQKFIDQA